VSDRPDATLYSFRRCPYAIRARSVLLSAGYRPGPDLELREVVLKAKPPELLGVSAKGTVPVLVHADGSVLDESLAIMHWALAQRDPGGWWAGRPPNEHSQIEALIAQNDGPFKHHLDRFKYASRYCDQGLAERVQQREAALVILRQWNQRLTARGWLLGECCSLADVALLPFVRQFWLADPDGFAAATELEALQRWLQRYLASSELAAVLAEPWVQAQPWRSPSWLYHLALSDVWQQARAAGSYSRSTRGRHLNDVGFIHLSEAHQVPATATRFYNDCPSGAVTLLVLDRERLGAEVRYEPAPDSGELFPHLYGALPLQAVVWSAPWRP